MTKFGPISTKAQYYENCKLLRIGNTLRFWDSYEELLNSDYKDTVSIRNKVKDGTTNKVRLYEINQEELPGILDSLDNKDELGFTEDPPNKHRTIQGEFSRIGGIPHLTYTTLKEPMYLAFKKEQIHISGWRAIETVRRYADSSSYEWILEATDLFSDISNVNTPVIEFTCFNINIGTILHRNTIIWEIRNY